MKIHHSKRILLSLFLLLSIAFSIFIHLKLINNAQDDAFIHIRIAENFERYNKLYFNAEEKVYSTSSVIWTLFLGTLFKILPSTPQTVAKINAICLVIGGGIFTYVFLKIINKTLYSWYSLFYFIGYIAILFVPSYGLMETPFVFMILGIGILLFIKESNYQFLIFSILPFLRAEFIIFSILLYLYHFIYHRQNFYKFFFISLLSATPIIGFIFLQYGTLIPNTIHAKSVTFDSAPLSNALDIVQTLIPINLSALPLEVIGILTVGIIIYFIINKFQHFRQYKEINATQEYHLDLMFFIAAGTITLLYIFGRNKLFHWYTPNYVLPLYTVLFIYFANNKNRLIEFAIIAIIISPTLNLVKVIDKATWSNKLPSLSAAETRGTNYVNIGRWLRKKYPNAKLMTSEIGGLGYGFKGYIYDAGGLASPEAINYHPVSYPGQLRVGIPLEYILAKDPDIIISLDGFIVEFMASDLVNNYMLIKKPALLQNDCKLFDNVFGSKYVYIYVRKDIYNE